MKLPTITTRPARYAGEGVKYCLQAAQSAAAVYDFGLAENYLKMAAQRAATSAAGPLVEIEEQVILCRKAQLTQGPERTAAAEAAWDYLQKNTAAPARLVLAVAQLCHDEGQRSRDWKWQQKAAQLACKSFRPRPRPGGSRGPAYPRSQPNLWRPRPTHRRT